MHGQENVKITEYFVLYYILVSFKCWFKVS